MRLSQMSVGDRFRFKFGQDCEVTFEVVEQRGDRTLIRALLGLRINPEQCVPDEEVTLEERR